MAKKKKSKKKKNIHKKKTNVVKTTSKKKKSIGGSLSSSSKCYIINNDTNEVLECQFVPTTVPYSRTANYQSVDSPKSSYPLTQYSGGSAREFTVDLFFYDCGKNGKSTGKINKARKFLENLLPPEKVTKSYKQPPTITFAYGYFIKKCVVKQLDVKDDWSDVKGNPIQTTFTLSLRQVM